MAAEVCCRLDADFYFTTRVKANNSVPTPGAATCDVDFLRAHIVNIWVCYYRRVSIPDILQRIPVYVKWLGSIGITTGMLLTFVGSLRKGLVASLRWIWHKISPNHAVRRVELKIAPDKTGYCQWNEASRGHNPVMNVFCRLAVTNVGTQRAFQIVDAHIKKPRTHGEITARGQLDPAMRPINGADERLATPLEIRFTVEPPCVKSDETFTADIVLVDQFTVEHVAKNVAFKPMGGGGWENLRRRNAVMQK